MALNKVQSLLSGPNAFYLDPDYIEKTQKDLAQKEALPSPLYIYQKKSAFSSFAKDLFSVLIFPIGLYRLVQNLGGKFALLPSSNPKLMNLPPDYPHRIRCSIDLNHVWKIKRFTLETGRFKVDAAIIGKPNTFENRRWVLATNGNGGFYENKLQSNSFHRFLEELDSNAVVFNYPNVGSSTGSPNRSQMKQSMIAMLNFLEDEKHGIGAKEIIAHGHSIGAGVQADATLEHSFKKDIRYVFIKSRTFSSLADIASNLNSKIAGLLIRFFNWNMDPVHSSMQLTHPEIIFQTALVDAHIDLSEKADKIVHDGVVAPDCSLAKKLLAEKTSYPNKYFLGVYEGHNQGIEHPKILSDKIKEMLNSPKERG